MRKLGWCWLVAVMLVAGLASAKDVESSVTVRVRHAQCDPDVWRHVEVSAMDRARLFCETRGGLDEARLSFVHDDGAVGDEHLCTLHLHFVCRGELPGGEPPRILATSRAAP